jgi:hypothetical protein
MTRRIAGPALARSNEEGERTYRRADFIGLPDGTALPMPKLDRCAVLWLTDKGYQFRWLNIVDGTDVSDQVWTLFLNICEVGRFKLPSPGNPRGLAPRIIGELILPEGVTE